MKTFGVVVFPGSNCDHDCYHAVAHAMGAQARYVWHRDTDLSGLDCVILPGGFTYGDYLRTGAIARLSPVMGAVAEFARAGGLVIGICNGFQILLEAQLLPGAMRRNQNQKFICKHLHLRLEQPRTPFTGAGREGQVLRIPIAHGEGNYYADTGTLRRLRDNGQIVFRYCRPDGRVTVDANPNGSMDNIAGICNEGRNVLGMMPHPERCAEAILGASDGRVIFESILQAL
ncbi:MAG TPA: phosphoribosylformylglycinamidine synthase subunit PurQ [Armatimonadota bacterium]|nr:phosphoribosylformylglycinamidine synthase subunit PurQ [Armatimonadota bacterium]